MFLFRRLWIFNKSPIPIVLKTKTKFSLEQDTQTGKKLIITATPIFDENGHLEFTVENCRDITELNNIKINLKTQKASKNINLK